MQSIRSRVRHASIRGYMAVCCHLALALVAFGQSAAQDRITVNRNWGPEQATGPPNTQQAGDVTTAWASATEDGQREWLSLQYARPVVPKAVLIYETYNPGALTKVSVFKPDGTEIQIWSGKDPTRPAKQKGISAISVKVDFKVKRVKIYLDSVATAGWNEIDAVGLRDSAGKTQWAVAAEASSTFGQRHQLQPRVADPVLTLQQRVTQLEAENRRLKKQIADLTKALRAKPKEQ